jgi:hypothetical protein
LGSGIWDFGLEEGIHHRVTKKCKFKQDGQDEQDKKEKLTGIKGIKMKFNY